MSLEFGDVASVAVLGVMALRLTTGARRSRTAEGRSIISEVRRGIGWRHVWPVPFVFAALIAVAYPLLLIPPLRWGWWSALGGSGNPVFGSSSTTAGTVWEVLIPLAFIALLVPALPLFAYAEERMFRTGAEDWSRPKRALKVLQFGMIHALIGIPIGAALALSIGGAYFMWVYLRSYRELGVQRAATFESTRAHTAYNACIIVLVAVAIVLDAVL